MPSIAESGGWPGFIVGKLEERAAHKQDLSDEERQAKEHLLQNQLNSGALDPTQYLQGMHDLYAHEPAPSRLGRIARGLERAVGLKKQAEQQKKEADAKLEGQRKATFGQPSVTSSVGAITNPDTGETGGGKSVTVLGPVPKNSEQAFANVESGVKTPEELAQQTAKADAARNLVAFQSSLKLYDQQNPHATAPDATPEEKQARQGYINGLLHNTTEEPIDVWTPVKGAVPEEYPKGSGQYRILKQSKTGEEKYFQMPETYTPPVAQPPKLSADERKRADWAADTKRPKDQTYESWVAEQTALGRRAGAPPIPRSTGGAGGKGKESQPEIKAEDAVDAAEAAYLDVLEAGGADGKGNNLDTVGSAGIIMSWLKGRVSRVTQTEISMVNNLGGAEMKLEGNVVHIIKGTISPQQYQYFLASAKRSFDIAKQVASKYKGVDVTAPDGSVHHFPTQDAADKFKKAAGIQ